MGEDTRLLEAILQRLNILVALQLDRSNDAGGTSITNRIRRLSELGISPGEIGAILGKKANYVSAVIGSKRKQTNEE
jgi:hypothetical protein